MKKLGIEYNYVYSSPQKIYLELTNGCNLNCKICYRAGWNQGTYEMALPVLEKIKSEIKQIAVKEIVIGGIGEPTISSVFANTLNLFEDHSITLTTNGTLLKENSKSIAEKVNKVIISVDGGEEKFYSIRKISLQPVLEGIGEIRSINSELEIYLQFVICKENISQMFKVIDIADQLQLNGIIFSNLIPQKEEDKSEMVYTIEPNSDIVALFNRVRNYSFKKGIRITLPNIQLKTTRKCQFIEDGAVYINCLGEVVPCYRFAHSSMEYVFGREKKIQKYSFGNITQKNLLDVWNNAKYLEFRRTLLIQNYPSCIDCDLVDGCHMAKESGWDCEGMSPTCGDCLWARKIVMCP